jgi:hypothetical protein
MNKFHLVAVRFCAVTLACLASATAVASAAEETYLKQLADRESKIIDLSGRYEARTSASENYVKSRAAATKKSVEATRDRYQTRTGFDYWLRNDGGLQERRLDQEIFGQDGTLVSKSIIAFDGRESYDVRDLPTPKIQGGANVRLGVDVASQFDMTCDMAILMGLSVPKCEGTLSACATNLGGELSEPITRDGHNVIELRFTKPGKAPVPTTRYVFELDLDHDLVILSLSQEALTQRSPDHGPMVRWAVSEFGQDPEWKIWFPRKARKSLIGKSGNAATITELTFGVPAINRALTADTFTPSIEKGSNVFKRDGNGYVQGGGISDRIAKALKADIEESRKEVLKTKQEGNLLTVTPPNQGFLGWIIVVIGLCLVVIALAWRWMSGRKRSE